MTHFMDADEAANLLQDGQSVAIAGVIGWLVPDTLLASIAARFAKSGSPSGLTVFSPVHSGDALGIRGLDHLAQPGLMKRVVSGSFINPVNPTTGLRPDLMGLIATDQVEAYSWPIGATMHWPREVARRSPGYLTQVGLGTYVDPRLEGGRMTPSAVEDLIRVVEFDGQEYLFYPTWPIDVAIIRGDAADAEGNVSLAGEPLHSASVSIALAAKASGGKVIAQVAQVLDRKDRFRAADWIPSDIIDVIVIDPEQVVGTELTDAKPWLGSVGSPVNAEALPKLSDPISRLVCANAIPFVERGRLTIFGFGMSSDVPTLMAETGAYGRETSNNYRFTTEHGSYGGIVLGGWQFSANLGQTALLDGPTQFDAIDGGLCHTAVLSFAEFSADGIANVSKFGSANPGAGGYIDIASNAQRLVLLGSFTAGGLQISVEDGQMRIDQEGRSRKFVETCQHVTYSIREGVARGQIASVVTERAIFDVTPEGLVLVSIAHGIDLERDVIGQMDFRPIVPSNLTRFTPIDL